MIKIASKEQPVDNQKNLTEAVRGWQRGFPAKQNFPIAQLTENRGENPQIPDEEAMHDLQRPDTQPARSNPPTIQAKLIFKTPKQPKKNKKHDLGWRSFEKTVDHLPAEEADIMQLHAQILLQASKDISTLAERLNSSDPNLVIVERGIHSDLQESKDLLYTAEVRPHITIRFKSLGGKGGNPSFHLFTYYNERTRTWQYDGVEGTNADAKPFLESMRQKYFKVGMQNAQELGVKALRDERDDRDRASNAGARSVLDA